ncbi:MAG: IS91 family transposase [Proteobacteria bacterium]|nr:IS91 family transposase [Pseudomonadota bacterium]
MKAVNKRHPMDVALILQKYGGQFMDNNKLCPVQIKAFRAISQCRTAAMGGHVERCNQCSHQRMAYNSCRNRNCNKCQYTKQLQWIDKLKSNLPVCRYFHIVFTIPSVLHKVFYLNQRVCYNLLFNAASQTLKKVALNPKFLGAETGAVAVLHTWGQALTYHPHIHMIVPAGGLSADGVEWIRAGKKFFLPVKALSKVFRGVMWSLLQKQIDQGNIQLPSDVALVTALKKQLYEKNWNVYTKKSLAGPQSVVQYLGKYTHRVAISNSRIVNIDQGKVTFRWKDYRKRLHNQLLTLEAEEFIGRFMRHVLPAGFYKIRYYGLLAAANRIKRQQCMALINKPLHVSLLAGLSAKQVLKVVTGMDPDTCPKCKKGKMLPHTILDPV